MTTSPYDTEIAAHEDDLADLRQQRAGYLARATEEDPVKAALLAACEAYALWLDKESAPDPEPLVRAAIALAGGDGSF